MMLTKQCKQRWARRRLWVSLALLAGISVAYVSTYLICGTHHVLLNQMCIIDYPGATRSYAFEGRAAFALGRTAIEIEPNSPEALQTQLLGDSIYRRKGTWHAGLWKAFYPLERLDHARRGLQTLPIDYSVAAPKPPSSASADATAAAPHN